MTGGLPEGGTVIDVGCGTGTFAIALAESRRDAKVVGVDGDKAILAAAQDKPGADKALWRDGLAGELPLADASADAIVMSLLLHHLDPLAKTTTLVDALRILRPGGRLHIADWGHPHDVLMRGAFLMLQALDGFSNTRDHAAGRLPGLVRAAGFAEVSTYARLRTAWGSLHLMDARKR